MSDINLLSIEIVFSTICGPSPTKSITINAAKIKRTQVIDQRIIPRLRLDCAFISDCPLSVMRKHIKQKLVMVQNNRKMQGAYVIRVKSGQISK